MSLQVQYDAQPGPFVPARFDHEHLCAAAVAVRLAENRKVGGTTGLRLTDGLFQEGLQGDRAVY